MPVAHRPIVLDTPSADAYPLFVAGTVVRRQVPGFAQASSSSWQGTVRVPEDFGSAGQVRFAHFANATTGAARYQVATAPIADGESFNPASFTAETAEDVTTPATAYLRKDVVATLTPPLAVGDDLMVRVERLGAHANDTLAVDSGLWVCVFEYTTAA